MKKLFIVIFLFFGSQEIFSAGGAPCGDYGECDSFKPELENIESLQLGALTFITIAMAATHLNTLDGEELPQTSIFPKKSLLII